MPEAQKVDFTFNVATGPVYRVTDLAIQAPPELIGYPPLDRSKLSLIPGEPADSAKILETEDQILNTVRGKGYALASVAKREVLIDHATREATGDLRDPARAGRHHGPGQLLRHRQGRHGLPAAPRAVQGRRALRTGQGRTRCATA